MKATPRSDGTITVRIDADAAAMLEAYCASRGRERPQKGALVSEAVIRYLKAKGKVSAA